jgi:hypothetical protein
MRTPTLANRNYFRWDLGVRKVESRRWAASLNYSYSQSVGSMNQALTTAFSNDPQTRYNFGPLFTDRTHTAQGWAYWQIPTDPWTQTLGAILLYNDGYPEERFYIKETPFPDYSLRIAPRGTYLRFNSWWELRVSFEQTIDVRKGNLNVSVQASNIFNNKAPEFDNGAFIDYANRLQTIYRQDPIELQLGAQYEF